MTTVARNHQFHNFSAGALADALGDCRVEKARLEEREKRIKAALEELGVVEAEGAGFVLTVEEHEQERLDTVRLRKKFGLMLKPFLVRSKVRRVLTRPRPGDERQVA